MQARLDEETQGVATVRVTDREGVEHRLGIDKESGDVVAHQYGQRRAEAGEEQSPDRRAARIAREKARYTVHRETNANVVRPARLPENLRAGVRIIDGLSDGEFVRYFREFYDRVERPSIRGGSKTVTSVAVAVYVDDDRIEYATSPALRLETEAGTRWTYDNPADTMAAPDREPEVIVSLRPGELSMPFGPAFRQFLIDELRRQVREIRRIEGESGDR